MFKILLVDDEHLEREALRIILKKYNEKVTVVGEAATGKSALELNRELKPDLIFMDIKMPVMDGIEATEIIKKESKDTKVIVLTAYDDFKYAQRALKSGVEDYILKPARPGDILSIVDKYCDTKVENNPNPVKVEDLVQVIYEEDYKDSKETLKDVVRQLLNQHGQNLEQLKSNAQQIAKKMLEVCEAKGIKGVVYANYEGKLNETVNPDTVEAKLFTILDDIFDKVITGKKLEQKTEISVVLNYIEKNFNKGITLEEVAEYVHLSPYYLSKLFKKELEINFVNYVTQRRMEKAKELLRDTDKPVLNIALELSYNEPNYFSKVFKKVVGMTPTEYRETQLEYAKQSKGLVKKYSRISNGKWYV